LKLEGRLAIFSIFSYLFQIAELYCILYLLPLIFPTRYTYSSLLILFFLPLFCLGACLLLCARPQDSEPNRILLATIHHMMYPITVEVLHQVFKAYGFVEKIVTFQKSAGQAPPLFLSHTPVHIHFI
jgi:hypothetical protein